MLSYIKTWVQIRSIEFFLGIKRSYTIKRLNKYLEDLTNLSCEIDKLKEEFNIRIRFCSVDTSNFYPSLEIVNNIKEEIECDNKYRDLLYTYMENNEKLDKDLYYRTGYFFQVSCLECFYDFDSLNSLKGHLYEPKKLKFEEYYGYNNTYKINDILYLSSKLNMELGSDYYL